MDEQKVLKIKQKALEGNSRAAYQYARCLEDGEGVKQDLLSAFQFYYTAAKKGDKRAAAELGEEAVASGDIYDWFKYLSQRPDISQIIKRKASFELGYYYKMNRLFQEAFQSFLEAAQLGGPDAEYEVAEAYYVGKGIAKDSQKAFDWYKKAANDGCEKAYLWMGIYYNTGFDSVVSINKEEANRWFNRIADNNQVAKFNLAMNIKEGEGVEKDLKRAFQLLIELSEAGFNPADEALGRAKDTANIKDWYEKLEKEGNTEAIFQLAELDHDNGVSYDKEPCWNRYVCAADGGNAEAAYIVAQNYKSRDNNCWEYIHYICLAADGGFPDAEYDYGSYLQNKKDRTEEETKRSFQYLFSAANSNHTEAMFLVAYAYAEGVGIRGNRVEAVDWFRKYIQKGGKGARLAYCDIGICYFYGGAHLETDKEKAYEAFKEAAKLGNARAQYYVGRYCDFGYDVVEVNYEKAYSYYKKALNHGSKFSEYESCCFNLAYNFKYGKGTTVNLPEAFEWYQKAAKQGYKKAIKELGDSYQSGDIKDWLRKLDEHENNSDAMVQLAQILMNESDIQYTGNNLHEAFGLLLKTSEMDNKTAQHLLGRSYESKDIKDWYEQLVDKGNTGAKFQLAEMLREQENASIGEECLRLYQSASDDGCMEASYRLACYYKDNDHRDVDLYAKYLKMSATEESPQYMFEYACFIYDSDRENSNILLQKAADLGEKEAQFRYGQILYSGDDVIDKDYKKAYKYLKEGGSEEDIDDADYPCNVNPCVLSYGFWLHDLYENGDKYAGTLYVLQPEFRMQQVDSDTLKETISYLGNIAEDNNNEEIGKTLIWAIEQLCEATGDLDGIFSYFKDYEELIKKFNMFDKSDVLKRYYIYECVDQFLKTYINNPANQYFDENGHGIYSVPDLSQAVSDFEITDDEKDFWYDCALTFDLSEKCAESIFIYEYAALLGSRKAWYTLGNMAQEESQYFLEIIDNF